MRAVHPSCVKASAFESPKFVKSDMIIFGGGLSDRKQRTQNVGGDQGGNEWDDGLQPGQNLHSYVLSLSH